MISSFWFFGVEEVEIACAQGAMERVLGVFGQRIDLRRFFRRFA